MRHYNILRSIYMSLVDARRGYRFGIDYRIGALKAHLSAFSPALFRKGIDSCEMTQFSPVSHVIFDMDGLLLDTQKVYSQATREVCREYNKEMSAELITKCMGISCPDSANIIIKELHLSITPDEFCTRLRNKCNASFLVETPIMPDTEIIYLKVMSDIVSKYGKVYSTDVRMKILGTMELDTARIMVKELQLPITPEEFSIMQVKAQNELLGAATLLPGAERLIRHFHAKGVPIAVATSSGADSVAIKTAKYKELFGLFHHIVMGNSDPEVTRGKPNPDIFLVCASRFPDKPDPTCCLVFEDAPNGVTGARAAGMQVVMVPDPTTSEDNRKGATVVLDSLEKFKPEQFGLPQF